MTFSFRSKLLAYNIALVTGVVLVALLQLSRSLGEDLRLQLVQRLEQQARGAAVWIGEGRRHTDKLAGRLALVVGADVTIVDKEGVVLGDSRPDAPVGSDAPREASMPEIVAAHQGEVGHASRIPPGASEEMLYVAVPATDGLIVRLSLPLASVNRTVRDMNARLAFAFVLAVVAAVAFGFFAARVAARPLRSMTDAATRLAAGEYDVAPASTSPDEFGTLASALTSLGTQLKTKIDDLTRERDRLSAILAGMVEGVLVLGKNGQVLLANPAASTVLGARGDLEGKGITDVVTDAKLRTFLEDGLARRGVVEGEAEIDGEHGRSIAVYLKPLAPAAGGGVVTVLRDMTRIRRLLAQRRDLVANVSHELRTPVTAIQGYAETLLRGTGDEATRTQFLEIVFRHAQRLGKLVESILELSDLEVRSPEEAVREPVEVGIIADNVAATLEKRLAAEGVTLRIEIEKGALALADPSGLEQVIENLVDNGIKYGRAKGTITLRGARAGDKVRLSVTDDGEGIAASHLPHVFERFYRVDPSRSRERGGAGLGLAIVKQLVEGMGGDVEVSSVVPEGTTFTVTLPAARA